MSLPRAIWTRLPDGRSVQVWQDADGSVDVDVSDLTPAPSRTSTPTLDAVALADLLARCS